MEGLYFQSRNRAPLQKFEGVRLWDPYHEKYHGTVRVLC